MDSITKLEEENDRSKMEMGNIQHDVMRSIEKMDAEVLKCIDETNNGGFVWSTGRLKFRKCKIK